MDIFLLKIYWPELFLSYSITHILIVNAFLVNEPKLNFPNLDFTIFNQVGTILFYLLLLLLNNDLFGFDYNYFLVSDLSSKTLKTIFVCFCILSFPFIWKSFVLQHLNFFEYFVIYLIAILALLFLANAFNLMSIYLCLELQAISFYVLAAFQRNSLFSNEAGLKYFISSSLISGFFLMGCALLYGSLGSLNLHSINLLTSFLEPTNYELLFVYVAFGIYFIISALLFKLVIAPYHIWFPQIYDGSPLSSTIIFSIVPKIILISLFIKVWSSVSHLLIFSETTLFLIGVYSIFFGLFKALKQKRLKKLYIYSSISQMGLPICALVDNTVNSLVAVYFFLIIYLITSVLLWGTFVLILDNQKTSLNLKDVNVTIYPIFITVLKHLKTHNSTFALCFLFLFFSLAAIPPLSGFLSKILIYSSLIQSCKYEASILIIYVSVFGVYYYLKFLKVILFENSTLISHMRTLSIFESKYLALECNIYAFCMFLLLLFCFYPNIVILKCIELSFYPL